MGPWLLQRTLAGGKTENVVMIGSTRIGRIANNPRAAMAFAVEMTNYLKKYSENAQCWARVGGATGELAWNLQFPDLASVEKFNEQLLSDDEYWKKVEQAREQGLFDQSTFEDGLWRQIA
jgi:hypothetical protein